MEASIITGYVVGIIVVIAMILALVFMKWSGVKNDSRDREILKLYAKLSLSCAEVVIWIFIIKVLIDEIN